MKELINVSKRDWLNPEDSSDTGAIHHRCGVEEYDEPCSYIDAALQVRDCSRSVDLEFSCYDEKSYNERLIKIDKIIEHCKGLRSALVKSKKFCKPQWDLKALKG